MSVEILRNVYLFKTMGLEELQQIDAISKIDKIAAGQTIFNAGDSATAMYIIKHGSVKLHKTTETGENIEVATLGTGSHFGEIAMLDGDARSANAEALEPTELVVVDYKKLEQLLKGSDSLAHHFYKAIAHFLAKRLRTTTVDFTFAKYKNLRHF